MTHLRPVEEQSAVLDERQQSVVSTLNEWLQRARAGEFQSIAIVAVAADGKAMPTTWSLESGDVPALIGHLAVLQCDLMTAGRGG